MRSELGSAVLADGSRQSSTERHDIQSSMCTSLVYRIPIGERCSVPVVLYLCDDGGVCVYVCVCVCVCV